MGHFGALIRIIRSVRERMDIPGDIDTMGLDRTAHFENQPDNMLDTADMLMMDYTGLMESTAPKPRSAHFPDQPIMQPLSMDTPVKFDNGGIGGDVIDNISPTAEAAGGTSPGDDWSTTSTYISKEDAHDLLKSSGYRSPTKKQPTRFSRSKVLEQTGFMIGQQKDFTESMPKRDAQAKWRAQLESDQQLVPVDINIARKQHLRMIDTPFGQRRVQADASRTVMGMSPENFLKRGEMIREQLRLNRGDVTAALSTSKSQLSLAQMRKVRNGIGGQDISEIEAEEQFYSVPRSYY